MRRISNASSNDTTTSGKKFVPWEPSKPSVQNINLPNLIPYSLPKSSTSDNSLSEELINQIRNKRNGVYKNGFIHHIDEVEFVYLTYMQNLEAERGIAAD